MASEQRYRRDVQRTYEGDGFTVTWEPALCIHVANCFRGLPEVFQPNARPWVDVDGAPADDILKTVLSCPTGALGFLRDGVDVQVQTDGPVTIEVVPNGPLFVRGRVTVVDSDGGVIRTADRIALCRCGHSRNKPFCDLSHRVAGFRG